MSIKDGVKLTRALSLVPHSTSLHLKMAIIISDINGMDAAMAYVEGLKATLMCAGEEFLPEEE